MDEKTEKIDEKIDTVDAVSSDELAKPKIKPPAISTKVLILMVAVSVVLVGALGVLAYNNYRDGKSVQVVTSPIPSEIASIELNSPQAEKIIDEGVTWTTPEKIDDQGLFEKTGSDSSYDSTDYYKVGKTSSGGEIIIALINFNAPGLDTPIHRIIKNGESFKRIAQNSSEITGGEYQMAKKLSTDSSFVFKSLLPDTIIAKDQTDLISVQKPRFIKEANPDATEKKIISTKWGDLFLEKSNSYSTNDINQESSDKTQVVSVSRYFIKLNDSTEMNYEVRPKFLRDDNTLNLDFKVSGLENKKYEKFETGGCGYGLGTFPSLIDNDSLKDNELIGSASDTDVYRIKDTNNKTLIYAYMLYKSDQAQGKATLEEFSNNSGFVYWTDAYGSSIGYLLSDYKPAIECGKPVVYLYPQEKTNFKVYVGAEVTKSEPLYEKFWSGVAYPGGKLVVDNKEYQNLFWEGKGYGQYPKIDFGRIIETKNAKTEITSDLKKQNLNDQEIADFLDFWLEKMPKTQYTRLSWLTNYAMNSLAPLNVTPKPDSVIRVFLDFGGLNKPVSLNSQELSGARRDGFTVVEWGGLLRGE
jgi:hypothetical protein